MFNGRQTCKIQKYPDNGEYNASPWWSQMEFAFPNNYEMQEVCDLKACNTILSAPVRY